MNDGREQLRQLYDLYAPQVYRRCQYLLRDDDEAQDAMHDVFIKVQKNLAKFREQSSPLTWMTRIATNHCLNILRSRRALWRQQLGEIEKVGAQQREPGQAELERQDLLRAVLARVDKDLQELAVYYFIDAMKQNEIALATGLSVPTVRKRLRKFLQQARRELQRQFPDLQLKEMLL